MAVQRASAGFIYVVTHANMVHWNGALKEVPTCRLLFTTQRVQLLMRCGAKSQQHHVSDRELILGMREKLMMSHLL